MELEKLDIEVEPLVLEHRPRILAQIGLFIAIAAAVAFGIFSFKPSTYKGIDKEESSTVVIASSLIFVASFVPAIYLFKTL